MLRRTSVTTALVAVLLHATAGTASAGGGCHMGVTTGEGDTVEMLGACFTPTILRVEPGTTVTWINKDAMTHNVTANQWGHFDPMDEGDVARATFDEPGVYPYACTYHPGMSGAIVVGDGEGAGDGAAVTVESWDPPAASDADASTRLATSGGTASSPAIAWIGGAILGFALAVAGGAVRSASRREEPARQP